MQAKYKGRLVTVLREAQNGDPEWTGNDERMLIESADGRQTVLKAELVYEKPVEKKAEVKKATPAPTQHSAVVHTKL